MEYENQDMPVSITITPTLVKAVQRKGGLVLIQWDDGITLHRSWIKNTSLIETSEGSYVVDPHVGIPYGFNFAELVELKTTPELLDRELKRKGIWTLDDLRSNPAALTGAIQAAYGVTKATILQRAEAYAKELKKDLEKTQE